MTTLDTARKPNWRILLAQILFLFASIQTFQLVDSLQTSQLYKADLSEINHIRYGLLNANVWAKQTAVVLEKKIDEFELNDRNKAELRHSVERIIDAAIDHIDQLIREKNLSEPVSWWEKLTGEIKQFFTDMLVDVQSLRNRVPEFTDLLFSELNRPGGKEHIKEFLRQKLSEFAQNTFNPSDMSRFRAVLKKYNCMDAENCQALISNEQKRVDMQISNQSVITFLLFTAIFVMCLPKGKALGRHEIVLMALSCLVLLLGGILTPMIEIEAKVSELKFMLLGEPILFQNQVLYFQSKSIMDVVGILTTTGKPEVILVGLLIAIFSIVFPIAKIIASGLYYQNWRGLRHNGWVQFFALRSGKWSMADVLVVALFMAYIGFSGIISSQLSHLESASQYVDVLTTDGTSLQAGFFLFLGFCLSSLLLSSRLERFYEVFPSVKHISDSTEQYK